MRHLLTTLALTLLFSTIGLAYACETWTEYRDGRQILCQKCGNSVFCS